VTHVPSRTVDDVLAEVHAADDAGDGELALAILEEARIELATPEIYGLLVDRCLALPPEEAEERLRRWWEQEHDRFSGAGLAHILVDRGSKEEALDILTESQGIDARPDYWRQLALLRDEAGNVEAAMTAMEYYTRLAPDDADAWMALADMQQRMGQNDRALLSLRRAGDAVPQRILPRVLRARILAAADRWREVRDLTEALLEEEYEDADNEMLYTLRDLLAQAYFILGDFDAARPLWQCLVRERPDNCEVCYLLGNLELTAGRYRQALAVL
jgi:tetratricopeptide (TPR) repeat protein